MEKLFKIVIALDNNTVLLYFTVSINAGYSMLNQNYILSF